MAYRAGELSIQQIHICNDSTFDTHSGGAVGAAVVDELVHAVRVVGEVGGHRSPGQGDVERVVDEGSEVAGDTGGIFLGHAGSRRSSDSAEAEKGEGCKNESAHFDV